MMGLEKCSIDTLHSDPCLLSSMMLWQTRMVLAGRNTVLHTAVAAGALASEPRLLCITQGAKMDQEDCPCPREHTQCSQLVLRMWTCAVCYYGRLWLLNSVHGSLSDPQPGLEHISSFLFASLSSSANWSLTIQYSGLFYTVRVS